MKNGHAIQSHILQVIAANIFSIAANVGDTIQKDKFLWKKSVYLNNFRKQASALLKIPAILFKTWKSNPKHAILTKGAETLCG